ncbi:MAG: S1 family peptidase [Bacillota bacterium]
MWKNKLLILSISLAPMTSAYAVFGGATVKATDPIFSSAVGIYNKETGSTCSGVLLSSRLVLTAAHCLTEDRSNIRLFFGADVSVAPTRRIADGVRHPEYRDDSTGSHRHDLAIIKIRGSAPEGFAPAKFLENIDALENMAPTWVAGYGTMDAKLDVGIGILRKTILPISDVNFSPSEISLMQSRDFGVCVGDSGGPSYIFVGDQAYVWGIAQKVYSYGGNVCMFGSAYTRVDYYRDWIEKASRTLVNRKSD